MTENEIRETLELAALAGGLVIRGYDYGYNGRPPAVLIDTGAKAATRWNSFNNDGDAFRLMVDTGLITEPPQSARNLAVCDGWAVGGEQSPRVRTRAAITIVAARHAKARGLKAV